MALIHTAGIHHVRLTVTDLARSRQFYSEVLGFEVAAESPPTGYGDNWRCPLHHHRRLSGNTATAPTAQTAPGEVAPSGASDLSPLTFGQQPTRTTHNNVIK
jgi:catechol 2,3-dioxygenase-like lactoylglutathione lyase family enzyme